MIRDSRPLIAKIANQVCKDHHDAFLVQIFGHKAANLGNDRLQELIDLGVLSQSELDKALVPGAGCDYIEFIYHVSEHINDYHGDLDAIASMREWGIDRWKSIVADRVNTLKDQAPSIDQMSGRVEVSLPGVIPRPPVPISFDSKITPDTPPGLRAFEVYGYQQAVKHAGSFARGLGQEMAHDLEQIIQEEWHEETIITEVDAEKRAEKLEIIREETAREFVESKDWRSLARKLADRTKEYVRNWERIARTELQACYNDARVISGVKDFGPETQIARVHEAGACEDCIRLCGDSQNPVVFNVRELFENGTNVGKRRRDWRATIFPIHPNCRCDTVVVPPGFTIVDGNMVREEDE